MNTVTSKDKEFEAMVAPTENLAYENLKATIDLAGHKVLMPRLIITGGPNVSIRYMVKSIQLDEQGVALEIEPAILQPVEEEVSS